MYLGSAEALAIAVVFDLLIGEPPASLHPVVGMGRLASGLARPLYARGKALQLLGGGAVCCAVVGLFTTGAMALSTLAATLLGKGAMLVEGVVLGSLFAMGGLLKAGAAVEQSLREGDLMASRERLRSLCSRDPSQLGSSEIASASVSSLAENTCDSVVAPLFYYALFGLPGAALYRAANTLDAVLGYRDHREYVGKVSARLDDVLNWVPARITALLFALAGIVCSGLPGRLRLATLVRDAGSTQSPNAGWPMATMAQLLGVRLEKPGHYCLEANGKPASIHTFALARRLCVTAFSICTATVLVGLVLGN